MREVWRWRDQVRGNADREKEGERASSLETEQTYCQKTIPSHKLTHTHTHTHVLAHRPYITSIFATVCSHPLLPVGAGERWRERVR